MESSNKPILPGSIVVVKDVHSIYRGYKGFVQRVTKKTAAVLFEGGNWDKLVTFQVNNLELI
ncbi:NAD(P)H dehydrogenase subunit NdhS [Prochlorococcus sp. AH-716-E13]|nr:NAD(P)H dehydrogenase subunit NdhS [Prochlorococcus sp. AH-716-E13]